MQRNAFVTGHHEDDAHLLARPKVSSGIRRPVDFLKRLSYCCDWICTTGMVARSVLTGSYLSLVSVCSAKGFSLIAECKIQNFLVQAAFWIHHSIRRYERSHFEGRVFWKRGKENGEALAIMKRSLLGRAAKPEQQINILLSLRY